MEWISVTDRLPGYSENVLILIEIEYENGHVKRSIQISNRTHTDKNGENWNCASDVAYWMPLPEPPKA